MNPITLPALVAVAAPMLLKLLPVVSKISPAALRTASPPNAGALDGLITIPELMMGSLSVTSSQVSTDN